MLAVKTKEKLKNCDQKPHKIYNYLTKLVILLSTQAST